MSEFQTNFSTFFSTLSQISFTIAGFLALTIASERESRKFWFQEKRAIFSYLNLFNIFVPGLISIFALPIMKYKTWAYVLLGVGFFYLVLWWVYRCEKRKNEEFQRLNSKIISPIFALPTFASSFFLAAVLYMTSSEDLANGFTVFVLCSSVVISTLNVMLFFKAELLLEDHPNESENDLDDG